MKDGSTQSFRNDKPDHAGHQFTPVFIGSDQMFLMLKSTFSGCFDASRIERTSTTTCCCQ